MKSELLETDRKIVRDAFKKSDLDVNSYISSIKLWFTAQLHLPETPCKYLFLFYKVLHFDIHISNIVVQVFSKVNLYIQLF